MRVAGIFKGRTPESHDRVADVFIEGALIAEDDAGHIGEIAVEQVGELLRVEFFGDAGEAANVAEQDGDLLLAGLHQLGVGEHAADDFRADVLLESAAHPALFAVLHQHAVERDEHGVGEQHQSGQGEIEPPAVNKREHDRGGERQLQQQRQGHPLGLGYGQPQP